MKTDLYMVTKCNSVFFNHFINYRIVLLHVWNPKLVFVGNMYEYSEWRDSKISFRI
jgi:hypothetical protein